MSVRLLNPGYPSERLCHSVTRILKANPLCSMATQAERGRVHINTAFFCFSDEFELYFLSDPTSAHCQNLSRSPQMAVAVFDSHQRWGRAHAGLQLFGTCVPAEGGAESDARELYALRFPAYVEVSDRLRHLRFYRFAPEVVKILDETAYGEAVFVTADVIGAPA